MQEKDSEMMLSIREWIFRRVVRDPILIKV